MAPGAGSFVCIILIYNLWEFVAPTDGDYRWVVHTKTGVVV